MIRSLLCVLAVALVSGCDSGGGGGATKGLLPTDSGFGGGSDGFVLPADSGPLVDTASPGDMGRAPADPGPAPPTDDGPGPTDEGAPLDVGPPDTAPPPDQGPPPDTGGPPPDPVAWTLAVLPDTQYYSKDFPWVFEAQTEWLADNAEAMGIRFVVHEGDITHNNTLEQWSNARAAMDRLVDGEVPFAMAPGNHDYGPNGKAAVRESQIDDWFSLADYAGSGTVTPYEPDSVQNTAHTFTVGPQKVLVLALEFGPRADVVSWADEVAAAHPDHMILLVTHAYLYHNDTRYDWIAYGPSQSHSPYAYGLSSEAGGVSDGEQLWQGLVAQHPGFRFTLNGHVLSDGLGRLASIGNGGNVVHQVLANYQKGVSPAQPEGGGGFLRLMRFEADQKTVEVTTYSPYLDEWLTDGQNEFTLSLDEEDYDYLSECSPGRVASCTCPDGKVGVHQCTPDSEFGQCVCDDTTLFPLVAIEDDPNNDTLTGCDPGPIMSPGADIDAAKLVGADGAPAATLAGCSLVEVAGCGNSNDVADDATGAPDAPGTEQGGGYVSLNGGTLTCGWSGGSVVEKGAGQVLVVHEIGKSVENYRLRLCASPGAGGQCTAVTSYGTGVQTIPVDAIFF